MPKLPFFEIFKHMLRSTFGNFGIALRLFWPWLLVLLPMNIATGIWLLFHPASGLATGASGPVGTFFLIVMGSAIVTGLACSSIAVNWHRYVLLAEIPHGFQRLRIDGKVWRYLFNLLGIGILVGVILAIPMGILGAIFAGLMRSGNSEGKWAFLAIFYAVFFSISTGYGTRMLLKVVGIAVGRSDMTLGDALNATQENTMRIIGLNVLLFLTFALIGAVLWVLTYFGVKADSVIALSTLTAVQLAVNWLGTILGITMLTSLYAFFVENRDVA
jgi:hypothetical protein